MKQLIIQNKTEDFAVVEDEKGRAFVYNHTKYDYFDHIKDDNQEFELHPISSDGIIDYKTVVVKKKKDLNPQWVKRG